jgi:hypothetical protein
MNENKIDPEVLQFMLGYYRNKCSQLEYEFLLFKASVDKQIKTIQSVANSGSNSKDSSNATKEKRKPNGQGN